MVMMVLMMIVVMVVVVVVVDKHLGDGGEHPGRLLPAHHRDTGVRPHVQEPGG